MGGKQLRSRVVWFCAVIFYLLMGHTAHAQQYKKRYLDKFQALSIRLMNETGIPASVILGVSMLESGMGTSRNARLLHNHFGIVGRNTLAKRHPTYRSRYKEYPSDSASFHHFVKILSRKKWYAQLQGKPEYAVWLQHMNHSGYSTAGQEWIKRVTSLIKRYKLYKLDAQMGFVKNS
ncbi:glucosaminidase domain-containing protein [Chitinophaga japonensis]|uniref:Flagellum-specific peptidoglycan hydrolase FlgJ n=1 Tax=Chitinophaga japonensis TaxID=104662 RepID=A0A562THJ5_CHIJA|nr:glucosaminidase domain-containing protein [Chitinophaga japonensis]TWI92250.1 flagellum-specific peptidoglycan hydrolase FlgJ [Chitinophaga japonensis]